MVNVFDLVRTLDVNNISGTWEPNYLDTLKLKGKIP